MENVEDMINRLFNDQGVYAHMIIVVACLVIKMFGFLVITRNHA